MNLNGFLLIDKPANISSHGVVNFLRRITEIKKIGHAGTLDPFATGLMICAVGRENTKKLGEIVKLDKEYQAEIILGEESDTFDCQGVIKKRKLEKIPDKKEVVKALEKFRGQYQQYPPKYSAKKIHGKKMYQLARKNIEFIIKPNLVSVYKLELIDYKWPVLKIKTKVSSGTYIRSLAFDIGAFLETGAYVRELRRTAISGLSLDQALGLDKIEESNWGEKLWSFEKLSKKIKKTTKPKWWNW